MSRPPVIAIVDDDEAVREALCDLLQVEGLPAHPFEDAARFLALAGDFDCVITDVRMPGIDGIELQRRLRTCGSAMPVIFVTSLSDEASCDRALREGAAGWFAKPVGEADLLAAVHDALRRGGGPAEA